jgi:hypothetical protein
MATPTNLPASFSTGAVLTAAQMNDLRGAFRVLQVVYGTYSTETLNNTSTFADTGLSLAITPQSTSSKILAYYAINYYKGALNSQNGLICKLVRGSTDIKENAGLAGYTDSLIQNRGCFTDFYLDSPSTTSSTTYKVQFRNYANAATVAVQSFNSPSTMVLMEISA